ncbi:site-specific integrase, partial [Streptosporangium lutulentum]
MDRTRIFPAAFYELLFSRYDSYPSWSGSRTIDIDLCRIGAHAVLEYAVELDANPLHKVKWKPPKVTEAVDPCVAVNPRQAQKLLTMVTYMGGRGRGRRLMALFTCMYYAALRPAEVVSLRLQDCHLPLRGRGRLTVDVFRPEVNT